MMADFPVPEPDIALALFADDNKFHTTTDSTEEAELVLQPYITEIDDWAQEWRLFFSINK